MSNLGREPAINLARAAGEVEMRSIEGEGDRVGTEPASCLPDRLEACRPDHPHPRRLSASTSPASRARLVADGAAILRAAGIDNPRLEARLLLSHALGVPVAALLRDPQLPADSTAFNILIARRAANEPLAYILGHREFWSLDFAVSPAVLIPRPDSETLIEAALAHQPAPRRILDLGTGSGCLLLAALHACPDAFGIGVDCSPEAARLAAANAAALGLDRRATFLCADWTAPLAAKFDLILCNPPYIPTSAIGGLMPEVARHEPLTALDGGADGLAAYRRIVPALPFLLHPDGAAVFELGIGQEPAVADIAQMHGLVATTRPDLAGIPRAMVVQPAVAAKKPFGTKASAV